MKYMRDGKVYSLDVENAEEFAEFFHDGAVMASLNLLRGETIGRDAVDGYIIDTCYCTDTQMYETAVVRDNVIVVEQYETEEEAHIGHMNWYQLISYIHPDVLLSAQTLELEAI